MGNQDANHVSMLGAGAQKQIDPRQFTQAMKACKSEGPSQGSQYVIQPPWGTDIESHGMTKHVALQGRRARTESSKENRNMYAIDDPARQDKVVHMARLLRRPF